MKEYYPGKDCTCGAYGECECGCGADWTDAEVYRLRCIIKKAIEAMKKRDYDLAKKILEENKNENNN